MLAQRIILVEVSPHASKYGNSNVSMWLMQLFIGISLFTLCRYKVKLENSKMFVLKDA